MFGTKTDLDRHVKDVFSKLSTDSERDAKCYMLAKQYYKIKDYETAIKYVTRYIVNVKNTAQCQRVLGECYEALNKPSKAFDAYRSSLELDGGQRDLVLKVCELLCDPGLPLVSSQASYWLDRLRGLYPTHPTVFKLKERVLNADPVAKKDPKELENLILSEIMARPNDATVRIRFLDFLVDSKRAKTAQEQAAELLSLGVFADHVPWYDCLYRVHQAYEKDENSDFSLEYQLRKLTVLERRSYLTLQDCGPEKRSVVECATAVFSFDQGLHTVSMFKVKPSDVQYFDSVLAHFRWQLASHLAILQLKRAKTEPGDWQRAMRTANPLLMLACKSTSITGRSETRDSARWRTHAAERISVCCHVLRAQAGIKGQSFLQEIHESCGGKWRERVYDRIFTCKDYQNGKTTSCFVIDPSFLDLPAALPSDVELQQFDNEAQLAHPDSLHHFVWLGSVNLTSNGNISRFFRCQAVPKLQLYVANFENTAPETLNRLDVDAFLYAAVFCSKSVARLYPNSDRPTVLPVSITESLCTQQQTEWWSAMYKTCSNQLSTNNCELRLRVKKGIETVRALGNHGLHPKLLTLLAKQFQLRASEADNINLKEVLEARAEAYWRAAIPLLERLEKHQTLRDVSAKFFDYQPGEWKQKDISMAVEEGKLFLACQLMEQDKHEDAVEALQALKSPYATYYQAVIYNKLASMESVASNDQVILLTRARDALRLTEDRLRRPDAISDAALPSLLTQLSDQVERDIARLELDGTLYKTRSTKKPAQPSRGVTLSENSFAETWSQNGESPSPRTSYLGNVASTPRQARTELFPEVRPELEKVINQIGELNVAKETLTGEVERLCGDVRDVKSLLQDLLTEFKKLSVKLADRPTMDVLKPEDLFELRDPEDYAEEEAVYSNVPQAPAPITFMQQQQLPRVDPYMQYCQRYMWPGGLPFPEGQPLPDFRGLATVPPIIPPVQNTVLSQPLRDMGANKHVPNVVVTSSDVVPAFSRTSQPIMSVTIPPEHVRSVPNQGPGTHAFQIPLPAVSNLQSPMVMQSPSDKYQARVYDQPTKALNFQTPTSLAATSNQLNEQLRSPANRTIPSTQVTPSTNQTSALNFTPPAKASVSLNSSKGDDSVVETEYDPRPDFKPIVSLPEVEVRTGEENETNLFTSEAKLFVFRDGLWKERGRGTVKILHDEQAGKVRVLMRREQVHKICANHHIRPEITLSPMGKTPNAFLWAAPDYSDEEVCVEKFCIRFQTHDEARDFEYAFNKGRELSSESTPTKAPEKEKQNEKTPEIKKMPLLATPTLNLSASANKPATKDSKEDGLMSEEKSVFGEKVTGGFDFTALAKGGVADAFKPNPQFKGFAGAGTPLFGAVASTVTDNNVSTASIDTGSDKVEEYEPTVEFTPVIPLPDLVEVKTGEEDEEVLYEQRAKILRFASETKEWKEKGVGNVKLLRNPESGKVRIVMRREQVHKVCCNHYLDENMKFERMKSSDKAATWTAQDFSEGELKPELLAMRFGKVETLIEFLKVVEDLQKNMRGGCVDGKGENAREQSQTSAAKSLSELFKKKPGTWECGACMLQNKPEINKCASCETLRPGATQAESSTNSDLKPLSEMFKKPLGTWECGVCLLQNKPEVNKCASCETLRPGAVDNSPKPATKGLQVDSSVAAGFSFGISSSTAAVAPSVSTPSFAASGNKPFTFGAAPSAPAFSFGLGSTPLGAQTPTTSTAPSAGFSFVVATTSSGAQTTPSTTFTSSTGFTFGASPGFTFGASSDRGSPAVSFKFGGGAAGGAATPVKLAVNGSPLTKEGETMIGSSKFNFTLKKPMEEKQVKSPVEDDQGHSDYDAEELEREDDNLTFKPVIPLPDKVPLHTGEEDEDVVYSHRAKLYRFVDGEWKERGTGDLKLLKHKTTHKVRLLMRREQVLKICLNHYLLKEMEFFPKEDRSWLWSAADFSEGTIAHERFCVRFRDKEIAQGFKKAVEREQNTLVHSPMQPSGAASPDRTSRDSSAARMLFKDDELVLMYEYQTTPEQQAEAERLQLPKNWHRYEIAEPCPGCPGCDTDNESVKSEIEKEVKTKTSSPEKIPFTPRNEEKVEVTKDLSKSTVVIPPVLQIGNLAKPNETIFGKSAEAAKDANKEGAETPKSSLLANFSFKSAMETPKGVSLFGTAVEKTTPTFGSPSGSIFGGYKAQTPQNILGDSKTSIFGNSVQVNRESTPVSQGSIFGSSLFGSKAVAGKDSTPIFGSAGGGIFGGVKSLDNSEPVFNAEPQFSFASLAQQSTNVFGGGTSSWSTKPTPVFSSIRTPNKDGESDDEAAEGEDDHDPQFQPIIDLPDTIEVRTGEEDEKILFCERAKLYRYVSNLKEWKERGLGDMKVLHNEEQITYRLLFRREQVHKVVCNMRITADTELKPMPKSSNSWLWSGMNFVDDETCCEQLAVKFKLETSANTFKSVVDECVLQLRELSLANSCRLVEDVSEEEDEDDGGDDYDDDVALLLSKDDVTLSELNENNRRYETIKRNLSLQVLETRYDQFQLLLTDAEGHTVSDTRFDSNQETAFKIPPVSLMWVAQDLACTSDEYKTLRIDLAHPTDAQDLYDTINAQDLPEEYGEAVH